MDTSKAPPAETASSASPHLSRLPRRYSAKWLGLTLAVLLLGGGSVVLWQWFNTSKAASSVAQPQSIPVKLQTIQTNQIQASSEFVGTLEAQERVSLQPQIQGRIDQVFVASGDRVQRGTPIVSLSLDQTQAEVASATAAAHSSRSAVVTAQAEVEAAAAEQAKAAANVQLQQVQLSRTQQLVMVGAQARQELDIAQNNLDTAIATLEAAGKQVDAARASLNQAQATVQQSEANIASVQVNLNYKVVTAPIDGVIGDFAIKAGDYISTGQTLTNVIQNNVLDMRISVPSNNAARLHRGLPVELLDASTGERLTTGTVSFIAPQVVKDAQSILIKVQFANSDGSLRDGQYVRARIIWSNSPGLLVPTTALKRIGGQSFVFVAQEDTANGESRYVVHQQAVTLGDIQGSSYQVIKGIAVGDRIAVSSILQLRDGAAIQPEP